MAYESTKESEATGVHVEIPDDFLALGDELLVKCEYSNNGGKLTARCRAKKMSKCILGLKVALSGV